MNKKTIKKLPLPTDRHVGQRVRMRRMQLNMSQEKLGDAIDLTFQQVQKYEKGTNRIGASRLQQIAKVLQTTPAFFFDGLDSLDHLAGSPPDFTIPVLATTDGLELVRAFGQIPLSHPKMRRRVVDLVAQIAAGFPQAIAAE